MRQSSPYGCLWGAGIIPSYPHIPLPTVPGAIHALGRVRGRVRALGRWPLHAPGADDVAGAAEFARSEQLSFWDAMIIRSAVALGCQTLWSEDLDAGQRIARVTVRNPFTA